MRAAREARFFFPLLTNDIIALLRCRCRSCRRLKRMKLVFVSSSKRIEIAFPGSLFSASIVINDNGGREERPWERGCRKQADNKIIALYFKVRLI